MSLKTDFPDGLARCGWLDGSADYTAYHDLEWGRPWPTTAPCSNN